MRHRLLLALGVMVGLVGASLIVFSGNAKAAEGEFFLQVSPSPLVITVKPGETITQELKIRNVGPQAEKLTIAPRSFAINNETGEVAFDDTKAPPEIGEWTKFSEPNFSVGPGEWFTQKITLAIPKEAGFSYSFAFVIKRQDQSVLHNAQRELKGTVAVFALVNIDKPGATRTLELGELKTEQGIYEYLPAKLSVQLRNVGNSIVRPSGNVFIQRGSNDQLPISTLKLNEKEGYILPGSTRTLAVDWTEGYPASTIVTDASGQTHVQQDWNLANLSNLRIGHYTAKVIAIYNDGQRDVPLTGEVSFWVIPWKLLLIALVIIVLLGAGVWSIAGKLFKGSGKRTRKSSVKFRK